MTQTELYILALWRRLGRIWAEIVLQYLLLGTTLSDELWDTLIEAMARLMEFEDLQAAADLQWRGLHRRLEIPQPTAPDGVPDMSRIRGMNDWYDEHAKQTHPIIQWRAQQIAKVEREYIEKKAVIAAELHLNIRERREVAPQYVGYRLNRFRRDAIGQIENTAKQLQLAIPEVGAMFPYLRYVTREDARVRPTHAAMHGFVALRTWPGWSYCVTPTGFNCRCGCTPRTMQEAIKAGWADSKGNPKFIVKWPNTASKMNYDLGIPFHGVEDYKAVPAILRRRIFPDPGPWMMPRFVATSADISAA